eukprot:scaffold18994_cov78-Skeletonema_menzelii.AAC.1
MSFDADDANARKEERPAVRLVAVTKVRRGEAFSFSFSHKFKESIPEADDLASSGSRGQGMMYCR